MLFEDVLCNISGHLCTSGHPQTSLDLLLVCSGFHNALIHTRDIAKRRCRYLQARVLMSLKLVYHSSRKQGLHYTDNVICKGRTMVLVERSFCGNHHVETVSFIPKVLFIEHMYDDNYIVYSHRATSYGYTQGARK